MDGRVLGFVALALPLVGLLSEVFAGLLASFSSAFCVLTCSADNMLEDDQLTVRRGMHNQAYLVALSGHNFANSQ